MKFFLTRRDLTLSWQALALVVEVRWRLWRQPFARLQSHWRGRVQSALNAAAASGVASNVARDADETPDRASIAEVWDCSHAVRRTARLVPMASCLTQAMALQMMLARRGHHCDVRIGVERRTKMANAAVANAATANAAVADAATADAAAANAAGDSSHVVEANPLAHGSDIADGQFRAHAWVEWHGRVLIGGDVRGWKPLALFAPVAPPTPTGNPSK